MDSKEIIRQTLKFWLYQLDNNLCVMEQLNALSKKLQEELCDMGTVEDFAKFFDKPEQQVRNVIHEKVVDTPRRRVFYHFAPLLKNIPKRWLKTK